MGEFLNGNNQIIELTPEQQDCVDYLGDRTLFVKGAAGSGKSLVIQYKAKQYIEQYAGDKNNRVLVLTFNKTLANATRQILRKNGDTSGCIAVGNVDSYLLNICRYLGLPKDTMCDREEQRRYVREALALHRKHYGVHPLNSKSIDFWIGEIEWMKDMNITIKDAKSYYLLDRSEHGSLTKMSDTDRQVAFQIYYCYKAVLTLNKKADYIDCALYIIRHKDRVPDKYKYDHLLIDEAQDFSLSQMMAVMMLFRVDMLVALDINQRLYNKHWTTDQLGIKATTKKLTKPMRTTRQIYDLAESLRSNNDEFISKEDDYSEKAVPKGTGPKPEVLAFENDLQEKAFVIGRIKAWLAIDGEMSIGILAATNKKVDDYASWMADADIPKEIVKSDSNFDIAKPGVKIVTTHSVKGLEFHRVIIPEFVQGLYPFNNKPVDETIDSFMVRERNRAYVAMTRAKYSLVVTYVKKRASQFLVEMDENYYDDTVNDEINNNQVNFT